MTQCRTSLIPWSIEAQRFEGFVPAKHHAWLMQNVLQRVISGDLRRVMINMPPGSAKTRYTSHLLPPLAFQIHPRWHIIGAAHTADYAETISRTVQGYVRENAHVLNYELRTEAVGEWWTTKGGFYFSTGVGGSLPGRRADLAIIDDPMRGREDADSIKSRDRVWNWFWGDLRQRIKPRGRIIIMATRWHEDDLMGRMLATQPGAWTVINIPAEAGENDLLGRKPGGWLWDDQEDDYPYGAELAAKKAELEQVGSMREWSAQFQGNPRPATGSLFRVDKITVIDDADVPKGTTWVRAWDLAGTKQVGTNDPDSTVGVKLGKTPADGFIIADVVALTGGPDAVEAAIKDTAQMDGHSVRIGIPQDPGQAGKSQVSYLTKKLIGYTVESSPETGDKATRAGPPAAQVNIGNVSMLRGLWNARMREELAAFPAAKHDDHVDAFSRAFAMLDGRSLSVWRRAAGLT